VYPRVFGHATASLAVIGLVMVIGACGGQTEVTAPPTPTVATPQPVAADPPVACYGLALEQCSEIADVAISALTDHSPITFVEVGPPPCEGAPCPRTLPPGADLPVTVQFSGAKPRLVIMGIVGDGLAAADAGDPVFIELTARSASGAGPGPHPFTLGHCGVFSPIDFDGSFWDAVGRVDLGADAAINSADGTLRLTSPTTAQFATPRGFRLDLVRHSGAKAFRGCA
jgi:hypothetical protein